MAQIDKNAVLFTANTTNVSPAQVIQVLSLLIDEQCTVPFITRYRKEKTGGLDEVQIRAIQEGHENYLEREKRRAYILETIKKMELLTPDLEKKILKAETINQLEDLYAPFKSKKKTKGQMAIDAGLLPLSELLWKGEIAFEKLLLEAQIFLNPEKKITNIQEALNGAMDILIEKIAHDIELKEKLRSYYWQESHLVALKKEDASGEEVQKFKDYFDFKCPVKDLNQKKTSHRFLAMRRGMALKILKLDVEFNQDRAKTIIESNYSIASSHKNYNLMEQIIQKSFNNYLHPSLDLEIKTELKKLSDEAAIEVFGINLKNLLLQPYLGPKAVLGVDPGIRTGCKLAIVDNTGKLMFDTVIYPHPPQNDKKMSAKVVRAILDKFNVTHIAIGNGTYGRETLSFFEEEIPEIKIGKIKATSISEAGASVYSASDIAREEFPDKDPTVRGAVSIARRFQDPLAELVKIDPKSIGVGQYQHDVNQARLKTSLEGVVESCVNFVGVDLNTASAPLLSFISGIGPVMATNVVKYREEHGTFKNRAEVKKVSRFYEKVFQQAAGFLRIYEGENPLDTTFIHPEQYKNLEDWAKKNKLSIADLPKNKDLIQKLEIDHDFVKIVGEFTHQDIIKALKSPSQDPRTEFKSIEFRNDIKEINDLKVGEWYPGVITNITQFGAFVDIGIKENGLLHISQMADKFVEDAVNEFKVGQELKVKVIQIDGDRKRISLSCKKDGNLLDNVMIPVSKNAKNPKINPEAPLKNNAFASLKNLRVK